MLFDIIRILIGFVLSIIIALTAHRLKSLNRSGAFGAILVGTIIFGLGGITFAVPLLFFFISGSTLSMLQNSSKRRSQKFTIRLGPRTFAQVFANGGPAAVFAIAYAIKGNPIWFVGYLACLCEAAADTWATEIGMLSKSSPVSIVSFKPMPTGQSGAISLMGTVASLAATLFTMASARIAVNFTDSIPYWPISIWFAAAYAGFVGSILDSVLGAVFQGLYRCRNCGKITEDKSHCSQKAARIKGIGLINNDAVNFISSLLSGVLALWIVAT
jgi:uncharacterized protein (TIGR00297 family)